MMTEYSCHCEQVLFAFMVGLHNLYWYYGSQTYKKDSTDKLVHTSEAFQGFGLFPFKVSVNFVKYIFNQNYSC